MTQARILIVEDHLIVAKDVQTTLENVGYSVPALASSKQEAIQKTLELQPDLVLMDINLQHEMDGVEAAEEIRTHHDIPVVYLTSYSDSETLKRAKITEPFGYLLKPYTERDLYTTIEIALYKHETEKKLRESEARYRAIVQDQTELICRFQADYTLTFVNDAYCRHFKKTRKELIGQSFLPFIPEADHHFVKQQIESLSKKKPIISHEHRIIQSDGKIGWQQWINRAIFDESGRLVEFQAVGRDITLRKHAEEELLTYRDHLEELVEERTVEWRKSNEQLLQEINERRRIENELRASETQYRLLADSVADGIAIIQDGKIVFANDAFSSIYRVHPKQLPGSDPLFLFPDEFKPQIQAWLNKISHRVAEQPFQIQNVNTDEQEVWMEWTPTFIAWEGKPAVLLTVRDITERKRQELEMEQAKAQLERENLALKATIRERYKFGDIIGKSAAMQRVYEQIVNASASDASVIIYGESGTGKELVARTIHQKSLRRENAFVAVNCGAISESLFESEFFGYRKGAFTGADRDKRGYLDVAHHGTLFLDEIGELSHAMQVKLLRVLENREYIPVGDNTPRYLDLRVIAATNRNPAELQRKELMRKDFFYRIHVISITVPPLRDHKEDIPLLVEFFGEHLGEKAFMIPANMLEAFNTYDWPGNVRELQNELQRFLAGQPLDFIEAYKRAVSPPRHPGQEQTVTTLRDVLEQFEKHYLLSILETHHWHRTRTAKALGIPRRTLHRKMKKFEMI